MSDPPSQSATASSHFIQGITPPKPLDISSSSNAVDNWKHFKQVWQNYAIITNLAAQTEQYRVALFLHCLGTDALKVYNGMQFETEEDRKSLEKIIQKFDEFTIGEVNETYERYIFNGRNQATDESIDAYVTVLRSLAKTCGFCDCLHDSLLRDRIVLGVNNQKLRKRLLQERKLDLKKCIDLCRSSEAAASHMKSISGTDSHDVHRLQEKTKRRPPRKQNYDRNVKSDASDNQHNCKFCGKTHPMKRELCPAWKKRCQKCNGRNHFASVCRKGKQKNIHAIQDYDSSDDNYYENDEDYEFLAGIHLAVEPVNSVKPVSGPAKEIYTELQVNDANIKFQIDCGASINIITESHAGSQITPSTKTLKMWNGTELRPRGVTRLLVKNPKTKKKYSIEFVVVPDNFTPLIGARTAQQMNLITIHTDNFVPVSPPERKTNINSIETAEELTRRYSDIFSKDLGTLPGTIHLQVDENAQPSITPPRRVPTALKEKYKKELKRLEDLRVISKVDDPTKWVSSVVIATKKSGALRICIDPRPLNQALKRETYQLPILDDLMPELAKAKIFSTVDLTAGYWHCVLDDESSLLTTFATPFGRYRWRRLPFGLSASSEIFQKRVSQALEGLEGILNITDDILVYGVGNSDEEARADHDRKLEALLQRCREHGIALNRNKLKLRIPEVSFMGHIFSNEGLKIDPDKAKAVLDMPSPEDVEGVQRLNGFVNYLAKFLPKLADHMEPIRRLTRQETEFVWSEEQEKAFTEIKKLVTTAPVLSYYDPKADLEIQCDASQKGLGAALLQKGKPIAYASRALTDTEQRYAQIEKEMLAIVFALEKFNQYTYGRHVKIQSDHKPLESILKKSLACAPRRLQGMMLRLQKYDYEVRYERGKDLHLADTLSRAYLQDTTHPTGNEFDYINATTFLPVSHTRLKEIQQATKDDETLRILKDTILNGWPDDRSQIPPQTTPYFSTRDELTVHDGVIFRGQRIVIPSSLRQDIKNKLHASHLGGESCLRRARETVFWPGMSAEIKEMVATCETCRKYETSNQKESLMPHEIPNRPWEQVGVDFFELNKKIYMITVDYYSNFWEIDHLKSNTATAVILRLKYHFARHGCPDRLISDNGPPFDSSEFRKFAKEWDFEHCTSSPGNSKANGKVESAVKTAKKLIRKAYDTGSDPYIAILDYRNTPTQGMSSSPAQRLLNRRARTLLPTTKTLLLPGTSNNEKEIKDLTKRQQQQSSYYNRNARDLPTLAEGDVIRMKPFRLGDKAWKKATVTSRLDERSYMVETSDGETYRRNRYHLKKTKETPDIQLSPDTPPMMSPAPRPAQEDAAKTTATPQTPTTTKMPTTSKTETTRPQRIRKPPTYLKDFVCK